MIRRQQEPFRDQLHIPVEDLDRETLGAQILKVCIGFDSLVRTGHSSSRAVDSLLREPHEYNPELARPLREFSVTLPAYDVRVLEIKDLMLQMVLDQEVRTTSGTLLVQKGVEITEPLLARLQNFYSWRTIPNSVRVLVPVYRPCAVALEN